MSNSAITLIALVITIIVLLILAGVVLNLVMGENGIFSKAKISKEKTNYTSAKELLDVKLLDIQAECAKEGKAYNVKEVADTIELSSEEQIILEKYYYGSTSKKKDGITKDTTKSVIGIVVSVSEYPQYKFLIGQEGKITGVTTRTDIDSMDETDFDTIEEFEQSQNIPSHTDPLSNIVDNLPPKDFEITAEVYFDGIKINANAEDADADGTNQQSGIDYYKFFVTDSNNNTTEYNSKNLTNNQIQNLPADTYSIYAIAYDKKGNSKQSTNTVENLAKTRTISYKLDLSTVGNTEGITKVGTGNYVVSSDNKYVSFDGACNISIEPSVIFPQDMTAQQKGNDCTISYWYRTSDVQPSGVMCTFGENGLNYVYNVHILSFTSSKLRAGQGFATVVADVSADNFYNGNWHFVTAVYSEVSGGKKVTLYYDDEKVESTGSYSVSNYYLNVGGPDSNWDARFKGDISKVEFYNKALSENEINQIKNEGKAYLNIQ